MTFLIDLISVLVVLGIMVLVHEFGHFVAAKLCGVRVEQFSIGFPPRLFGKQIGETDYCISAIPLGGYVKMTGETLPGENLSLTGPDGETIAAQAADPKALTSKPRWQRMIIGVAGPFSNFILALLLMTGFYMFHHEIFLFEDQPATLDWVLPGSAADQAALKAGDRIASFDGKVNPSWFDIGKLSAENLALLGHDHHVSLIADRDGTQVRLTLQLPETPKGKDFTIDGLGMLPVMQANPVTVKEITPGAPAAKAGVQDGDRFLSIDGHVFHSTDSVVAYLQSRKGAPLNIQLSHNGKISTLVIQPYQVDDPKQGRVWRIGFAGTPPPYRIEQLPVGKAISESVKFNRENSLDILVVLQRLLTHKMSVDNLSGPIGIAQQTGQAASTQNWGGMVELMSVISLNLGILNLLPFPILDGGMILFLIIESLIRRDINMAIKERVYQVAFVVIILFFAFIMFNDISKLAIFNHGNP
jgi:regulator of sigma E protease